MKMKVTKNYCFRLLLLLATGLAPVFGAVAQSTSVSGKVSDAVSGETLIGANILIKGKVAGTTSDYNGNFKLQTTTPLPFTLIVSVVGYTAQEVEVTADNQTLEVKLQQSVMFGQEVVVSASRVEEKILESPVTIEKMDLLSIRNAAAPSFYDALANLKGVEMSTQSLTFKSFNTRGFNANGNVRTVQMIDGMDNQAPGLNFSVGNIVGISELDLESVELLPGASSALYGPNAINGILLMNSKNPFQYQGLSAQVKTGIMSESGRSEPVTPFYDLAIRYAKAFNDKVAFKVNVGYLAADDWQANDFRDQSFANGFNLESGNRQSNPGFNGVNIYGDESAFNMRSIAQSMIGAGVLPQQALGLIPDVGLTRTGYAERDLADYATKSLKFNGALHWRLSDKVEAILQGSYGFGTTVYTGADRYSIANFNLGQYKAEIRGSNFYVRAYTTQERSGDAYAVGILAQGVNEAYNPSQQWLPEYVGAYVQAVSAGASPDAAHAAARGFADRNRLEPGSSAFNSAVEAINNRPIPGNAQGVGAKFTDKTNLYHAEGMYNFKEQFDFIELIVGANVRQYALNSEKTLFATDDDGNEFKIMEYGGYAQAGKKLFNDALKLSASLRYDKNENFDGQFSPRASAVYTFAQTSNIRLSYQTGFRIPTVQDQYIDLSTPQARLIGGLPLFRDRYNLQGNPAYSLNTVQQFGGAVLASTQNPQLQQQAQQLVLQQVAAGQIPNDPAIIQAAIVQTLTGIAAQTNQGLLQPYQFRAFQPERVQTFEIGYKGLISNKLLIDAYFYNSVFKNFNGADVLVQDAAPNPNNPASALGLNLLSANTRQVYSMPVNREQDIRSLGWALGLDYSLPKGYTIGGNVSYNSLSNEGDLDGFITSFNTPEYRANFTFGNREVVKNLGFNVAFRWQDEFVWQSSFVSPEVSVRQLSVIPAYSTLDAQISLKVPSLKTIFKLGGSNILGTSYTQAWGNPAVGGMYYISALFDQFLN